MSMDILAVMSSTLTVALAIAVPVLVLLLWCVAQWRSRRDDTTTPDIANHHKRFDTTMGELRDMREALGAASQHQGRRR